MLNKKIAFIGPGVMAEAMIAGLLRQKLAKPENLTAAGPRPERGEELHRKYGIRSTHRQCRRRFAGGRGRALRQAAAAERGDEGAEEHAPRGAGALDRGRRIHQEDRRGPEAQGRLSVRCRIRPGRSARASPSGRPRRRPPRSSARWRKQILGALGEQVFVEDESYLDMATALSGTGPAYVFLFTEALIDAGVHMGFPAPHRRAIGAADHQRLGGILRAGRAPSGNAAEPGHLARRDLGRGAVLSGEGRLPHRDLTRRLGGLPALAGVGQGEAGPYPSKETKQRMSR